MDIGDNMGIMAGVTKVALVTGCQIAGETLPPAVRKEDVMKIRRITSQHRRDFRAIFECEYCGFEKEQSGYDDSYFHQHVIPKMKCEKCGFEDEANPDVMTCPKCQGPLSLQGAQECKVIEVIE